MDIEHGIAQRWCESKGSGWSVLKLAGSGGTASTFSLQSPDGLRALKIISEDFSSGDRRAETAARAEKQFSLGIHDCPYLVQTYCWGEFEGRYYILMSQAPGSELATRLKDVPRQAIRDIIRQVAIAAVFLRSKGVVHRDIKSPNVYISDDFSHATLLDLTVIRDIHDPIGLGTDQTSTLPVVATSRYTPPEYLFRLEEYSSDFWHALDVYQLGGLLHDLIMQEQMFYQEYELSKDNRYRFAWIVATQTPSVSAADVEADLVLLARRALVKDWRRRSKLRLEDFLLSNRSANPIALELVGSRASRMSGDRSQKPTLMGRLSTICNTLDHQIAVRLATMDIKPTHEIENVTDMRKVIAMTWGREAVDFLPIESFALRINVGISQTGIDVNIDFISGRDGNSSITSRILPTYTDELNLEATLEQDIIQSFIEMINEYAGAVSK